MRGTTILVSLLLLGLTACRGEDGEPATQVASERPTLQLTAFPEVGESGYLGARTVAQTDSSGAFVVADAYDPRLVFFDGGGVIQGEFGRGGDGPGEFDRVAAIFGVGPHLLAWDMFKLRVTLIGPQGQLLRTFSTPFLGGTASPFLNRGMASMSVTRALSPRLWWTDDVLGEPEPVWRELDPEGVLGKRPEVGERRLPTAGAGRLGRFYLGWGHGSYVIHVVDTTGAEIGRIQRDIDPPPRNAEDLDRVEERRRRVSGMTRSSASESDIYPFHPHFRSFHEDACGRLWVDTYRRDSGGSVVDLFSPEGQFVAAVTLPVEGALHEVTSDRAYLIIQGLDDVAGVAVVSLGQYSCYPDGVD